MKKYNIGYAGNLRHVPHWSLEPPASRKHVESPALVIELKYDKDTEAAISQIKKRNYPQQVADYTGDILLVGINYDKETKRHKCQIERWRKENVGN